MSATEALPLADLTVLEFSHAVMGPCTGMILADLGAEVIKVEPTPNGDATRRLAGAGAGFFGMYSRNKKSLAIDLKAPRSRPVIEALAQRADVLIENFAAGSMDRLGLGYERLSALNPRLVYCALKGFLSGPYEERRALDEVVQMMSGLAYMTGPPGQPLRAGASVIDVMGAMSGVLGILVALKEREHTGRGRLVRSGLFENAVLLMGQHMAYAALTGKELPPLSVRITAWGIYDLFETSDGASIFVGVVTDQQWRRFCEVFGRADLLADEDLGSNNGRVAARDRLLPDLRAMFAGMTKDELLAKADEADLAYAPVSRPVEMFDDPHLNAGDGLRETVLPGGVKTKLPSLPFQLGDRRFGCWQDPPALGAHNAEILAGLDFDEAAITELAAAGVIATVEGRRD